MLVVAIIGIVAAAAARAGAEPLALDRPARSKDGKTLALPTHGHDLWDHETAIDLVAPGRTAGEHVIVRAKHINDTCDPDTQDCGGLPDTEDHTADVSARLAAGGYAALPFGDAGTVDGVTMTVSGSGATRALVFRAGRKVVAKTTVRATVGDDTLDGIEVKGFAVVRGKTSWIYVQVEQSVGDDATTTEWWTAVKARLPKPR